MTETNAKFLRNPILPLRRISRIEMNNLTNTSSTNSTDEIYLRFKDAGLSFELISWATIKFIFALISQIMCASVVYVTIKSKTLRQSYNILIVANCICGFFFMFTFSIQFGIIITGINFIPLKICFPLMIIPIFFVQSQYLLYLALSIDRLITVMFPIWHLTHIQKSDRGNKFYLFFIFTLIICYAGCTVLSGINPSFFDTPNKQVSCSTPDAVPAIVFQVVVYYNFVSLICYLLLWGIMRKNANLAANLYATRRILNSIISVFLLEFFGWFGNTLTRNVLTWLQVSPLFLWRAMNIAGIILVPILALYAPVLYIMR
uniref:G-protein coupled receptors family 1 profile domain-containing protein n=2 Tax=Meloidogyne TaxID=189290 RepID=A0A6V7UAU8_MELEN|nr:unnamed protein product [Meloidogyne enterolobii]